MFNKSPFETQPSISIPDSAQVVFVSDLFAKDYQGGAELTTQALIDSSPFEVYCVRSNDVTMDLLESGHTKYWIFGNYSRMNLELIPTIISNLDYSVLEYDFKYCRYRSPEKHAIDTGKECDCHDDIHGKLISSFYHGAKSLWWMSEKQMEVYLKHFPFLAEKDNTVLSSVFDDAFFLAIKILRERYKDHKRKGWVVLGSTSWIKGADLAEQWCKENNKDYEILWGIPYDNLLEKLAMAEGFVYLPKGNDTCPRMVIEAKLLGCKLHINDYVQHKDEIWFDTDDMIDTESYLFAARERFWRGIKINMEWVPNISGYTTTLNPTKNGYPWKASIESMLEFCNEVVVVDGGSTDGSWEELLEWSKKDDRIKSHLVERDWEHKRFAVFDGMQKAEARSRCTGDFLWQMDADEIVHENDCKKIIQLIRAFPSQVDLISLPVIEYWGSEEKVRMDVNPWKWRLSRNNPNITHGIPGQLRKEDDDGNIYASLGTDGCDYIFKDTLEMVPHASFYSNQAHELRSMALQDNEDAIQKYQEWFQLNIDMLPSVHHYSWFDLERKIKTYKDYWSQHWQSLYDITQEDTPDNNMFFNKSWDDVTEDDISELANDLKNKMGGWVFHSKVDFSKPTRHLTLNTSHPKYVK